MKKIDKFKSINQLSSIKKESAMRKSFTRLLGLIMLFSMMSLSFAHAAAPTLKASAPNGGLVPADNPAGVAFKRGDSFVMTFSDAMEVASGTGIIGLYNNSGIQIEAISVTKSSLSVEGQPDLSTNSRVKIEGATVTVTFDYDFKVEGAVHSITITGDAFRAYTSAHKGDYFAGLQVNLASPSANNGEWNFTVGDYTTPTIVMSKLAPKANDEAIAGDLTPTLIIEFSELIKAGTGDVVLYEVGPNGEGFYHSTYPATSFGFATAKKAILTLNDPAKPVLKQLTEYYVRVEANAFEDLSTHSQFVAPITNSTDWRFRTADMSGPTVDTYTVGNKNDVAAKEGIIVSFKDNRTACFPYAANSLPFVLSKADGTAWVSGNDVTGAFTIAATAPAVAPAFKATYIGNNQVKIEPTTSWAHLATYTITTVDPSVLFFDNEKNAAKTFGALGTYTFKAGDFEAPKLSSIAAQGAGLVLFTGDVAAGLDETKLAVKLSTADDSGLPVEVYCLAMPSNSNAVGGTAPTVADVLTFGTVLPVQVTTVPQTIIHTGYITKDKAGAVLASNTKYDIYFVAKDKATTVNTSTLAELLLPANMVDDVLTNDINIPVVQSVLLTNKNAAASAIDLTNAAHDATTIDKNSPIKITFDEKIILVGSPIVVKSKVGTAAETTIAPANYTVALDVTGTILTITPAINTTNGQADFNTYAAGWKSGANISVSILASTTNKITDEAGLVVGAVVPVKGSANILPAITYNFKVEDYQGPVPYIVGTSPLAQTASIASNGNIVVDFGEAITNSDAARTAFNANNIFLRDAAGNLLAFTATFENAQKVTIDPVADFLPNFNTYTVEFTQSMIDLAGNTMNYWETATSGMGTSNKVAVTTKDENKPAVTFFPTGATAIDKDGAGSNNLVVNVTFNEAVYNSNGDAVDPADENFMRSLVTVKRVSDNVMLNFDIKNGVSTPAVAPAVSSASFDIDFKAFMSAYDPTESYVVTINGLFDAAKNAITANTVTLKIREYEKPTLASFTPYLGQVNVPISVAGNTTLTLTYSENVTANAGNVNVYRVSDDALISSVAVGTATYAGALVTVSVPLLVSETGYYVKVDAGAFKDAAGNLADAYDGKTTWKFTTKDSTKPLLTIATGVTPADNSTTATLPTSLVLNFTETGGKIVAGAGKIYIREVGNIGLPDFTFMAQDATVVTIANQTVTIKLNTGLKYNQDYWVEIDGNAFKDEADNSALYTSALAVNASALLADATAWNFKTNTDPAPNYDIVNSNPKHGATSVDVNIGHLVLKFTEPVWLVSPSTAKYLTIRNTTLTGGNYTAHATVDFGAAQTWTWNAAHDELTVPISTPLVKDTKYFVTVTSGTFVDHASAGNQPIATTNDLDGGALIAAPNVEYSFETTDQTAPTVNTIKVNDTDVASSLATLPTKISKDGNIVITFSEPVTVGNTAAKKPVLLQDASLATLTYTYTFDNNILTINPDANFVSEETITVSIVANDIKDVSTAKHDLSAGIVGKFKAEDTKNPEWPAGGFAFTAVPGNNKITINTISTSEATTVYYKVVLKDVSITNTEADIKATKTGSFAATAVASSYDITGLASQTAYDIYFTAEDAAGNLMNHTVSATLQAIGKLSNVSTLDNVKPLLVTKTPEGTCIPSTTTIKLKFNEKVRLTALATGAINDYFWVRNSGTDKAVAISGIAVQNPGVAGVGNDSTIVITLGAGALPSQTAVANYYVEINPNAIEDIVGNIYADFFYGKTAWTFSTGDEIDPKIKVMPAVGAVAAYDDVTPRDGSVVTSNDQGLTIQFDEDVAVGTGNIYIWRIGSAAAQEIISVNGAAVTAGITIANKKATIPTHNKYSFGVAYYVTMDAGVFVDMACKPVKYAGMPRIAGSPLTTIASGAGKETWVFYGKDEAAPMVTTTTPVNTAQKQSIATTITIDFSEEIYAKNDGATVYALAAVAGVSEAISSLGITIKDDASTPVAVPYTATVTYGVSVSSPFVHNVTRVVLTPTIPAGATYGLKSETTYTVTVPKAKVYDVAKSQMENDYVFTFRTDDYSAPVATFTPANAAKGIPVDQKILITFDEGVVNNNNVILDNANVDNLVKLRLTTAAAGVYVKADATINANKTVITITPESSLKANYEYEVILDAATYPLKETDDFGVDMTIARGTPPALKSILNSVLSSKFIVKDVNPPAVNIVATKMDVIPVPGSTISGAALTAALQINVKTEDYNGVAKPDTMKAGSGYLTIYKSNGQVFDVIDVATGVYTTPGNITIAHKPLVPDSTFYITYPEGAFTDGRGNKLPALTDITKWSFSTLTQARPSIAEFVAPVNKTIDANKSTDLVIRFKNNLDATFIAAGKQLVLYKAKPSGLADNGDIIEVLNLSAVNTRFSGSNYNNGLSSDVVIFDITANLVSGETYYVKIDSLCLRDKVNTGLTWQGISSYNDWYFTIGDDKAPSVVYRNVSWPATTKETIKGGSPEFKIAFNKDIALGTGKIRLYQYYENALPGDINSKLWSQMDVTASMLNKDTLKFTFPNRVVDGVTSFYILIDAGVIKNTSSNAVNWNGYTSPLDWTFATSGDDVAPMFVAKSTNVVETTAKGGVVAKLIVKDDQGIRLTGANFKLAKVGVDTVAIDNARVAHSSVANALGYYSDNDTIKITFVDELVERADYFILVGNDVITDMSTAQLAFAGIADSSWAFSMNDLTAPKVMSVTPTDNSASSDSMALTITFSENVQPGTVPVVISKKDDSSVIYSTVIEAANIKDAVATIPVKGLLVDNTAYVVTVAEGVVTDMPYGDYTTVNKSEAYATAWEFSTDDNVAPVIVGTPNGTNDNAASVTLKVTATEAVTPVAGKMVTLTSAMDTIKVDAGMFTPWTAENLVYIYNVTGLKDESVYTVTVEAGAFIDGAHVANPTAAIAAGEWIFGTGDNTAPVLVTNGLTPANTAELKSYVGVVLQAKFSEAVAIGTGNITVTGPTSVELIPVNSDKVTIKDSVVSIAANIRFGAYSVAFDAGAIKDVMGNAYAGTDVWAFSVVDNAFDAMCMDATHFMPTDGSTNIAGDTSLTIQFCEKVVPGSVFGSTAQILMYEQGPGSDKDLFRAITITADMIAADGMSLSIPLVTLPQFTVFDVLVEAGAIYDEAGNAYAGFMNPIFWNFTTGDTKAPSVVAMSTATPDASTNVTVVKVEFSEDVLNVAAGASVNVGTILSVDKTTGKVWNVVIEAADLSVVTLTLNDKITDASDVRNPLDSINMYTYTVGDNTKPVVAITTFAAPIPTIFTVNLKFSELVMNVAAGVDVAGATSSTIEKVSDMEYNVAIVAAEEAAVTIAVGDSITDAVGNKMAAVDTIFTVGDFTRPIVTSDPANGADVKGTFDVNLTFSDDAIVSANDIAVSGAVSAATTNVGNVYTVAVVGNDNTTVQVAVANTIKDEAGNLITGALEFSYKIGDNTPPSVSVDPIAARDTVNEFDLTIIFDEAVIVPVGGISVNAPATITYSLLTGSVYKANITAPDLATVVMTLSDAITDLAGNKLAKTEYTYTIGDHMAPTVTATPGSGTDLANNFDVVLTFSKDVTGVENGVVVKGGDATIAGTGKVYTVSITAADKANVSVEVGNKIVDASGNSLVPAVFSYTVGDFADHVAPTVAVTPGSGTDLNNSFSVTLTFSEDVTGVATGVVVTGAAGTVTGSGKVYTVAIVAEDFASVTVALGSGIKDIAGNALAASSYSYSVKGVVPPVVKISEIQGNGETSPLADQVITTKGFVTGIDAGGAGFFIQDAMAAWSGVYVYDKDAAAMVSIGSSVEVTGTVVEFNGLTEIKSLTSVKLIAKVADITATVIAAADVSKEMYEGVLVTVNQLKTTDLPDGFGEWLVKANDGTVVKIDNQLYEASPDLGQSYHITGVVNYSFSEYKLAPRMLSDLFQTVSVEDLGVSIDIYPNPFTDKISIRVSSDVVLTKAVITNTAGQLVKEVINPSSTIATGDLRQGVYVISLHTEKGIAKTERIIKR